MKAKTSHVGLLQIIERLPQSKNGNARFLISLDGFICKTPVDSCLADYVKNYDGKICKGTIGTLRGKATLSSLELQS